MKKMKFKSDNKKEFQKDIMDGYDEQTEDDINIQKTALDIWAKFNMRNNKDVVAAQLESYNNMIKTSLPNLLKNSDLVFAQTKFVDNYNKVVIVKNFLKVKNVYFYAPTTGGQFTTQTLTPTMARKKGSTYSNKIFVEIVQMQTMQTEDSIRPFRTEVKYSHKNAATGELMQMYLQSLPCMVGSKACITTLKPNCDISHSKNEFPGYFIINGGEKVLVFIVNLQTNIPIFVKNKTKNNNKKTHVKFRSDNGIMSRSLEIMFNKTKKCFYVTLSQFKNLNGKDIPIPIFILARALGFESDREIIQLFGGYYENDVLNMLNASINDISSTYKENGKEITVKIKTQNDALDYLGRMLKRSVKQQKSSLGNDEQIKLSKRKAVLNILQKDFLPHMQGNNTLKKGIFFGYLVKKLIYLILGKIEETNRDSFRNKGILGPGELVMLLMKEWWKNLNKEIGRIFKSSLDLENDPTACINILDSIKPSIGEKPLREAFNTGNWGTGIKKYYKGVSQLLGRLSPLDSLSHLRRILSTSNSGTDKNSEERNLQGTAWGIICPNTTPEGAKIGKVQTYCISAKRTINRPYQTKYLREILTDPFKNNKQKIKPYEITIKIQNKTKTSVVGKINVSISKELIITYVRDKIGDETIDFKNNTIIFTDKYENESKLIFKHLKTLFSETFTPVIDLLSVSLEDMDKYTKVFLNGELLGLTDIPVAWCKYLRYLRSINDIDKFTSIAYRIEENEVHILSSGNRLIRPVLKVEDNKIVLPVFEAYDRIQKGNIDSWEKLIKEYPFGIEYLDVSEEETSLIALYPSDLQKNKKSNSSYKTYTHCEIHGIMVLGLIASKLPFLNHNPSPRITYAIAHMKQAIASPYVDNALERFDKEGNILLTPQKQLITTWSERQLHADKIPNGINAVVAIMCYTGFNQEDSLIFNEDAIKRGLFHTLQYRTISDELNNKGRSADSDQFMNPENSDDVSGKNEKSKYKHLESSGFIKKGKIIKKNDAVIGKVTPNSSNKDNDKKSFRDASKFLKKFDTATVDRVEKVILDDGNDGVKVRVYQSRKPEVGDKFSNRYGQKGVISKVIPSIYMPRTKDGIVPDIIMNPHAIPSRMTMGQLLEMSFGKVCAEKGIIGDATPFEPIDSEKLESELENLGFNKDCSETMYCGYTGRKIDTKIFLGPIYYFRLKHMVKDKVYSRSRGPITMLTRQPVEGRARDGGQRLGEMERDNLLCHGISKFLTERMMNCSDAYQTAVCDICGNFANKLLDKPGFECKSCENKTHITQVRLPYASKLTLQQMSAMHIDTKLKTKNSLF